MRSLLMIFGLLTLLPMIPIACSAESSSQSDDSASNAASDSADEDVTDGADDDVAAIDPPTFWQDVAPILDTRCMGCHAAGGIGPMTFETYTDVFTWRHAIKASTLARAMPPWQATADGSCGEFQDSQWLSDDEIQTLSDWVDTEALEGTRSERVLPEVPMFEASTHVMTPEFAPVALGTPEAEFDEYRCFLVDLEDVTSTQFLTGYNVSPGNQAVVHHVIGNFVDPNAASRVDGRTNAEQMEFLDAESPDRLGWPCFSQAGPGVNIESDPIVWAPGPGPTYFPEDTGIRVGPTDQLVIQMHYNLIDAEQIGSTDVTRVEIKLTDRVTHELYPFYVDYLLDSGTSIPQGESSYLYRQGFSLRDFGVPFDVKLWGVMPHMHEFGVSLNATVLENGRASESSCMVQVDDWDFAWQRAYWYSEPVTLSPSDVWQINCTFDTSAVDEPVYPGWGTQNEMCLTVVYLSL